MAVRKLRRGLVPQRRQTLGKETVHVSPKTPFAAALKKVDRVLNRSPKARVIGSGRAIQTVLQLCCGLKERKYMVSIRTLSVRAVDERIDEQKGTSAFEYRQVPAIELIVESKSI